MPPAKKKYPAVKKSASSSTPKKKAGRYSASDITVLGVFGIACTK